MEVTAGRELDALVAEKVMECHLIRFINGLGNLDIRCGCSPDQHNEQDGACCGFLCDYSTSIDAAWEMVEKLAGTFRLEYEKYSGWNCELGLGSCHADTAPLAICLAALQAVGSQWPQETQ